MKKLPPRTDRNSAEPPLRILHLVLGRAECTIVDDSGNRVSIDDAKRLWETCRVEDYNLAFRRLVSTPRTDRDEDGMPEPFFTYGEPCENCGKPCDSRIWIPGFNYFGCDDCAEEARIVIFAEDNCETLYTAVLRSKSVNEVQQAFREHKDTCPKCNPKLAAIPARREASQEQKRERAA